MNTSIKKESKILINHSLIYGLGSLLNRLVGFIMIPIYTRFLSPADYGVLEIVTLTTQIISFVASSGITMSIGVFYFKYESEEERSEVLSTSIIGFSIISLFVLLPFMFFSSNLARTLLGSIDMNLFFLIAIGSIWVQSLSEIGFLYLRILKQSRKFLVFSICKLIIALSLNIYFIVVIEIGVIGVIYSTFISALLASIVLILPIFRKTGIRFSVPKLKEQLLFGLPIIPSSICNMVVLSSDKFFLRFMVSLSETGLYSLATRFAVIPGQFIIYPFMQIWSVRRLEIYKQANSEEVMGQVFTYFCLLVSFVGLMVSVLAKDVIEIMADPRFWSAYKAVPVLISAQIILSFFQHFNLGIIIEKKTKYIAYIDGVNAIVNLILNYYFIKHLGMMGAAYATLISYSMRVIMVYVVTIRIYRIYFDSLQVIKIVISAASVYLISIYIHFSNVYINLSIKSLLLFLFPLFLFIIKFFKPNEILFIKEHLQKYKSNFVQKYQK